MRAAVIAAALCCAALLGCGADAERAVRIEHAWSPPSPPSARMTAAYLHITTRADDVLLGASSPVADRVEMHVSFVEDGMMRMRPLESVPLPAGETVRFEPNGKHFMVSGLQAATEAGGVLPLQLTLQHAGTISVDARVQATRPQAH